MPTEQPVLPSELGPIVQTLQQWNATQGAEAESITFVQEHRPRLIIRCLTAAFEQQMREILKNPSWLRTIAYAITLEPKYTRQEQLHRS